MEIHSNIKNRYSPRAFSRKPIEEDKLKLLFEAARWAPSSYNGQSWRFVIAKNSESELWHLLFETLSDFNKEWVKNAPILVLTLARKYYEHNGKAYKHSWHDVGLSVGNLMNQATYMGIHIHQMAGFNADKAGENINIPLEFEPVSMIAIGYLGDIDQLSEELKSLEVRKRTRKDINEILFFEKWK